MKKFEVDYSETASFKGLRIYYNHIAEGVKYAKKNKIKDICIWNGVDDSRKKANFDFLEEIDFIETFEWLVPLTKDSDITGLKFLKNLKNLRYDFDSDLSVDFENVKSIVTLNTVYSSKSTHWNALTKLKELYIHSVDTSNLAFIGEIKKLEKLRVIKGDFLSIEGIENCTFLYQVTFVKCKKIGDITKVLSQMKSLKHLALEKCPNAKVDLSKINIKPEHFFRI